MGHRTYLSVHTAKKEKEVFEGNNFLPFFWITLLSRQHITDILPVWLQYEELCLDEEREEELDLFTDQWPSPCSIRIEQGALIAHAQAASSLFRQSNPAYTRLYDEFTRYIMDQLPSPEDHIRIDVIALAGFSSVQEWAQQLVAMIKALEERDIEALPTWETDPVLLTGFPAGQDFSLDGYPELKELSNQLIQENKQALAALARKPAGKKRYIWPLIGIVSGMFMVYASIRGYRKEGMVIEVVSVHLLGWLCLVMALYVLLRGRKS